MKLSFNRTPQMWLKETVHLILVLLLAIAAVSSGWTAPAGGTWKFIVIGDHRGDNDPGKKMLPDTTVVYEKLVFDGTIGKYIGFKDGGMNQAAVAQLAAAAKSEGAEFVLEIGDLVTKHLPEINGRTADELMTEEWAHWKQIWNDSSGSLPIYPVRGNQEYTASEEAWLAFTAGMPGIGELPLNGPAGEEGLTYAFHHKNCLFIGIDNYVSPLANGDTHVITPAAQAWLDQVLASSDRPFKFVYGHVPAFEVWNNKKTALTVVKDGLATPFAKFTPAAIADRDAFWTSIGNAGAEYFCGHEHMFGRGVTAVDGRLVRQTVIGNGGAPCYPAWDLTAYPLGPFAESYANMVLPSDPALTLTSPLIVSETNPRGGASTQANAEIGYVLVSVHGSHVTATYKAVNGTYQESWPISGTPE